MNFKEINIEDKKLMDVYLKNSKYNNCEYSFNNLFIWKHIYNVKYTIHKDMLVLISFKDETEPKMLMPIGNGNIKEIMQDAIDYCKKNNFILRMTSLSDEMIQELKEFMPPSFEIIENDLYDYIYSTEDLIELKGKKFSSKRNHIKKFNSTYDYEYIDITEQNIDLCKDMLVKWCETANCEEESLKQELIAVESALDNITKLELIAGGLLIDGNLIAFTVGQAINSYTFNTNIEKAFYDYQGAYAKINNEFAIRRLSEFKYINREEDLGIPNLRKAKRSYNPLQLVYKHDAILK